MIAPTEEEKEEGRKRKGPFGMENSPGEKKTRLPVLVLIALLMLLSWQSAQLCRQMGWMGFPASRVTGDPGRILQKLRSSGVEVLPRLRWNAAKVQGSTGLLGNPWRLTIHHQGAVFSKTDLRSSADTIRAIQKDHQEERGWADIGYHFVVDRAGRIWSARPLHLMGAHAGRGGANRGNLGILVLGNFDVQRPGSDQRAALARLVRALIEHLRIAPKRIYTHDEIRRLAGHSGTNCPGKHLRPVVEKLRNEWKG